MRCPICLSLISTEYCLENMPSAAQAFTDDSVDALSKRVTMTIAECNGCGTVQYIGPTVPYYKNAIRSSKFSTEMLAFRKKQFSELLTSFDSECVSVFELGAGEGEHLDIFKNLGFATAGVENDAEMVELCCGKGHDVIKGFFDENTKPVALKKKSFDCVVSFNFIEHLPDPKGSLRTLAGLIHDNGIALLEVPNFEMIDSKKLFNEFIPDHRFYFREENFRTLLSLSGFEILSVESIWDDYVLSAKARKRIRRDWQQYDQMREKLRSDVENFFCNSDPSENVVWSAGHQSLASISNLGLEKHISCVIDSSPNKQKKFCPVSGLSIVSPDILLAKKIRRVLVMAAGYNAEILLEIRRCFSKELIVATVDHGVVTYDKDNLIY